MLLKRLSLHNYSVFHGSHTLALEPLESSEPRNVVLIGGKNGAGKTSVLEALRLALYGPLAVDGRGQADAYSTHLKARINRQALAAGERQAWVELAVVVLAEGLPTELAIRRSWTLDRDRVREEFTIRRDGIAQGPLAAQETGEFLRDLVPPGVSQFFFFDGEQIQRLAADEEPDAAFLSAVRALLDLDLIDRLQADLQVVAREARKVVKDPALEEIKQAEADHQRVLEALREAEAEVARQQHAVTALREEGARLEGELHAQGMLLGEERRRLEQERQLRCQRLEEVQWELGRLAGEVIPIWLAGPLLDAAVEQLAAERWAKHWAAARDIAGRFRDTLVQRARREDAQVAALTESIVETVWREQFDHKEAQKQPLHDLSEREEQQILGQIQAVRAVTPDTLLELLDETEELHERLRHLEHELARVPAEVADGQLVERLATLRRDLAGALQSLGRAQEQADRLRRVDLVQAERALKKAETYLRYWERAQGKLNRIAKVRGVLEAFAQGVTEARVQEIAGRATAMHHQLARKAGELGEIRIDPKTLGITLWDQQGRPLPKARLSAGEKQIYAVSMLFGLAQASGRKLPVVIDTPLGRLDGEHKQAVVSRYFPVASHQVVLLATDTELDPAHYLLLAPFISHALLLDYRMDRGATTVSEGYFWAVGEATVAGEQA